MEETLPSYEAASGAANLQEVKPQVLPLEEIKKIYKISYWWLCSIALIQTWWVLLGLLPIFFALEHYEVPYKWIFIIEMLYYELYLTLYVCWCCMFSLCVKLLNKLLTI